MADNVAVTAGSGTTLATDDVAGVHYQRVKLAIGTADDATAMGAAVDSVAGASDGGLTLLAVRDDALTTLTPIDGDYVRLRVDSTGGLWVANADIATIAGAVAGTEMQCDIVAALPAGANAIGKLAANSGVDIGDVDVLTLPGVAGDVASDAADSGNPLKVGAQARTTNPTAVADADRVNLTADDLGRLLTRRAARDLETHATKTLTSTAETSLLAAGGAGVFHDVTKLILTNTSSTAVRVDIRDVTAGTVLFGVFLAADGGGASLSFDVPLTQATADSAWTAQLSAAVTDVRVFIQAVKEV